MSFVGWIETLYNDVWELGMLVVTKFSFFYIILKFLGANKAVFWVFEGIFDNVSALIADFSHLWNVMSSITVVLAKELDLIGETFVEIMSAKSCVLYLVNLHILYYINSHLNFYHTVSYYPFYPICKFFSFLKFLMNSATSDTLKDLILLLQCSNYIN